MGAAAEMGEDSKRMRESSYDTHTSKEAFIYPLRFPQMCALGFSALAL